LAKPSAKGEKSLLPKGDKHGVSFKADCKAASQTNGEKMARILILGVGNVLWADEGFGVRCVETLAERYSLPDTVRLLDGGTQRLCLLPFMEEADALIVFDAVNYGMPPSTLKLVENHEVPALMGAK
jgi:hydrogenase maturation protease